jgi:hypothetical protein
MLRLPDFGSVAHASSRLAKRRSQPAYGCDRFSVGGNFAFRAFLFVSA